MLRELLKLPLGVGVWDVGSAFAPFGPVGDAAYGAPSEVWTFLAAGGSALLLAFFDLNKKAIVNIGS